MTEQANPRQTPFLSNSRMAIFAPKALQNDTPWGLPPRGVCRFPRRKRLQVKETKLDTLAKAENRTVLNPRFWGLRALFVHIFEFSFGTRFSGSEWSAICFYFGILRRNDLQAGRTIFDLSGDGVLILRFYGTTKQLGERGSDSLRNARNHPPAAKAALISGHLAARINSCPFKATSRGDYFIKL
jgi:hypothetical protein